MRSIAEVALDSSESYPVISARKLKRILRIYRAAYHMELPGLSDLIQTPRELLHWIEHLSMSASDSYGRVVQLIYFLAEEATPVDVLEALMIWRSSESNFDLEMVQILQILLRREADINRNSELSATLIRVRQARLRSDYFHEYAETSEGSDDGTESGATIWKNMSNGLAVVRK